MVASAGPVTNPAGNTELFWNGFAAAGCKQPRGASRFRLPVLGGDKARSRTLGSNLNIPGCTVASRSGTLNAVLAAQKTQLPEANVEALSHKEIIRFHAFCQSL